MMRQSKNCYKIVQEYWPACPSTTPFGLALGPTNPGSIRVAQETLGLRWAGFSPAFLLLMPTFSLLCAPANLAIHLQRAKNAPLPHQRYALVAAASVRCLAPLHFRRNST